MSMPVTARLLQWLERDWPSLLIIVLGTGLQAALIAQPLEFLRTNLLPDDAFYYFQIGRNIADGAGSTFDGINATNGYHPLWMLIVTVFYSLVPPADALDAAPIKALLALSVAMNAATALFVSRIVARFSLDTWIRALGVAVWALNPFLLYQGVNGLETSLSLFFLSFFFLLLLKRQEGSGSYTFIGLTGAAMVLARLDMVFFLIAGLLWIFLREGSLAWKKTFIAGAAASVPVAAWFLWNITTFGMIFTSSSIASAMVNHALVVQDNGPGLFQTLKAIVFFTQFDLDTILLPMTGMYALALALLGAFVALSIRGEFAVPKRVQDIPPTLYLFAGFTLLFIANASLRWTAREWYFVSVGIFLSILIVVTVHALLRYVSYRRLAFGALFALLFFSFYVNWSKSLQPSKISTADQKDMYEATLWMNENVPEEAKIGAFNAGTMGYFSTRTVVNLDGLVNIGALRALQERRLWRYIKEENIEYIADFEQYITYRYRSFLGVDEPLERLSPIKRFPAGLTVYRVGP